MVITEISLDFDKDNAEEGKEFFPISIFLPQILCLLKYLAILSQDFSKLKKYSFKIFFLLRYILKYCSRYILKYCSFSDISFSPITFYAAAASSQQRLRLRYFVTPDNSIMTLGGTRGNCRKCEMWNFKSIY